MASVAFLGSSPCAWAAEWISFYPVSGELTLGFDGRWTEIDSGQSNWQVEYEERVSLLLGGHVLDRRIFTFNANLEPAFTQRDSDAPTGTIETDSQFLNYGVRFSMLHGVPASPISLNGNLAASNTETEDNLGNRRDITRESRGAGLSFKFRPFPSNITYRERSLEESFISGLGQPPRERDEFQRTLTYRGRSRGMELLLEGTQFEDQLVPDQSYESRKGRLSNNFNWGKNSRLVSRLEYIDREGFQAEERVTANELLRLQHTKNLFTSYGYAYRSSHRTIDTESHDGYFELNHRLYTNLETRFRLGATNTQSSDQFREKTRDSRLDFKYNKQIRPSVRVTANLGGGYRTTDRTSGQLYFTETPTVPATGIVVLTQRYIIVSSIIVTAPGCNPCLDGSDYLVEDAGGDFTQLRIPLGSRIAIGDTITVDYVYQPPTAEFYAIPYRVGLRLEYGPFAFYHRTSGEDQTYLAGPDPNAVGDRRTDTTGIEWNWARGLSTASAGAERIYTDTINRTTTEYLLHQTLKYAMARNANLNASFRESFIKDSTTAESYSGDISVNWLPAPRLTVTPRVSAFRRNVDPGGTDSILKAGLDVSWKLRQLSMDLLYDHTIRENNGDTRVEDRVLATFKRKF